MDSGASENLGPLDEVRANTKNQQDLDKEQVLTADANATPLEVRMRGDLFGKLKVEKTLELWWTLAPLSSSKRVWHNSDI